MIILGKRSSWSLETGVNCWFGQSMPSSCLQWRALAVLGALLSLILAWPFCVAARPITLQPPPSPSPLPRTVSAEKQNVSLNPAFEQIITMNAVNNENNLSEIVNVKMTNLSLNGDGILSRTERSVHRRNNNKKQRDLDRNERSANLSHITGATRKIQLYIKNRYLQLLPDGSVNGTHDDTSDYTILQRTTVDIGQIKIQSVATCLFLCMDQCGSVYGSLEFVEDCVFNEQMEQHHFNTYSSSHHSNSRRKLYLALNRHGVPRRVQISPSRSLGNLATYTKSLTQTVEQSRVEHLITQNFGPTYTRHGLKQLCDSGKQLRPLTVNLRPKPKCSQPGAVAGNAGTKLKKTEKNVTKKKKRRKCRDDEPEGEHCAKSVAASPVDALKQRRQSAQKQQQHKCSSNNEEDCGNLGVKKRPVQQKKAQNRQATTEQQRTNNKPNQIFAIKKLKPKPVRTSPTTTTTSTQAPNTTTEPDEDEPINESDEYDDHIGQSVQFVDDVYDGSL